MRGSGAPSEQTAPAASGKSLSERPGARLQEHGHRPDQKATVMAGVDAQHASRRVAIPSGRTRFLAREPTPVAEPRPNERPGHAGNGAHGERETAAVSAMVPRKS